MLGREEGEGRKIGRNEKSGKFCACFAPGREEGDKVTGGERPTPPLSTPSLLHTLFGQPVFYYLIITRMRILYVYKPQPHELSAWHHSIIITNIWYDAFRFRFWNFLFAPKYLWKVLPSNILPLECTEIHVTAKSVSFRNYCMWIFLFYKKLHMTKLSIKVKLIP